MSGRSGTDRKPARQTKTYRVSLQVEQIIYAEDEDEALGIFWDDLHENQAGGTELALVEEVSSPEPDRRGATGGR